MMIVNEPLLDRARQHAVRFLQSLPERPVGPTASRDELLRGVAVPLSDDGEDPAAVLDALAHGIEKGLIASAGPRYFGFVIGGSLPVSLAADWMTSAWDQNCGIYVTSPAASVVEDVVRQWLLELFDLPRNASVGLVTGGQAANFTALAAARHAVLRRAGWNVEEEGLAGAPRVHVVAGAEAHITIASSLRMLGFGTRGVIRVDTDEQGRVRPEALERALAPLDGPIIVCAQAGNVNSGAVDPLREVCEIAHRPSPPNTWSRPPASSATRLSGPPSSPAAGAAFRSTPRCAPSAAAAWSRWWIVYASARGRWHRCSPPTSA
jgi:glutamate/tyrosine decarboxylase-like PLP-dependent enzyme